MKVAFVLLVVAVASAYAGYAVEPYRHSYVPGFKHTANGIVSAYRNDLRQVAVNQVADHIGSGIGTGRFYGVPGTNGHYSNYGYGYGHGYGNGYGNGYGHGNAYGNGYGLGLGYGNGVYGHGLGAAYGHVGHVARVY